MSKMRLKYIKGNEVKYISHLDLLRTFQRAIKRAEIPIQYSQGFNPHPIVSFGLPLPVGTTSESEYMEMELAADIEAAHVAARLNKALPKGIKILEAVTVTDKKDKILNKICLASYDVTVHLKKKSDMDFSQALLKLTASDKLVVEKSTKKGIKEVDILQDIHALEVAAQGEKKVVFRMQLSAGSARNLKPELVLQAVEKYVPGFEIDFAAIHRTKLLANKDGRMVEPMSAF